jgi:hypothetical protein
MSVFTAWHHRAASAPAAAGKEKVTLLSMLGISPSEQQAPQQAAPQQAEQGQQGRARPRSALRTAAAPGTDGPLQPAGGRTVSRSPSKLGLQPHRPGTPGDYDSDVSHSNMPLLGAPAGLAQEGGEATCQVLAVVGAQKQVGWRAAYLHAAPHTPLVGYTILPAPAAPVECGGY